ncbi:MAG: hypothetical protein EOO39_17390 [Cytophagaceae bacterium]|nr:MAG: hypothetical protein EOO39_17390 [Cytophagaceae bacterium]
METLQSPLNEAQLELLRMFARPVEDADWQHIKAMITDYFAAKAIHEANEVWERGNWDNSKVDELLGVHLRTPYRKL